MFVVWIVRKLIGRKGAQDFCRFFSCGILQLTEKNTGRPVFFFLEQSCGTMFLEDFFQPNQPSQQLSLWMKQWTFHYSKFVKSNALKTDKSQISPVFQTQTIDPQFWNKPPINHKKRRPMCDEKTSTSALPKVQQTTLHPCTKGTLMRHNNQLLRNHHLIKAVFWWKKWGKLLKFTFFLPKKSYTYWRLMHFWHLVAQRCFILYTSLHMHTQGSMLALIFPEQISPL